MTEASTVASGIGFTEGPLWTGDGRLLVVSMSRGLVCQLDLDAGGVVGEVETGGGPNGLAEDDAGAVWVAQNGGVIIKSRSERPVTPGLQRIEERVDDVVTDGCTAPNDLAQGPDGRIWFTDPPEPGSDAPGRVAAFDRATREVQTMAEGIAYPNGLAFARGGETFYLAETRTGRILRYRWDGETLTPDGVFAELPAGPDGLALDVRGNLYVALPEADMVAVLDPDGRQVDAVRFDGPTFPTNVCFAGPERDVLVVTAAKGGRVLAVRGHGPGLDPVPARATKGRS